MPGWIERFGILASLLVAISLMKRGIKRLRLLSMADATLFPA